MCRTPYFHLVFYSLCKAWLYVSFQLQYRHTSWWNRCFMMINVLQRNFDEKPMYIEQMSSSNTDWHFWVKCLSKITRLLLILHILKNIELTKYSNKFDQIFIIIPWFHGTLNFHTPSLLFSNMKYEHSKNAYWVFEMAFKKCFLWEPYKLQTYSTSKRSEAVQPDCPGALQEMNSTAKAEFWY